MGDLIEQLCKQFRAHRCPTRDLTVDEFGVPHRGKHRARCFNPSKPERYMLKGFSLNEARTGYCLAAYMYRGKDELRPRGMAATVYPVHRLLQETEYVHHKNYVLWADNWFTGAGTIEAAHSFGVGYCGTAKTNRIKNAFVDTKNQTKGWARGTHRQVVADRGALHVYCTQWQDKKLVTMLSTFPGVTGTIERKGRVNGVFAMVKYPIPSVISSYNFGKIGTDLMDQQIATLYAKRRLRWHVKVFVHMMYISLHNAHISYKDLIKQPKLPLIDFVQVLIVEALGELEVQPLPSTHRHVHTPARSRGIRKGALGSRSEKYRNRGHCLECRTYTSFFCSSCFSSESKTWLCVGGEHDEKECWTNNHNSMFQELE
jgi:hypothetical protein